MDFATAMTPRGFSANHGKQEQARDHFAVNATRKLVRQVPGVSQIENWIGQAKELPQAVTV